MTKKVKKSVGTTVVYLLLTIWALTTIYPIIWVIQNSFKAKDKILANSFAMPIGELFTTANYRKAFKTADILGSYKSSLFIHDGCDTRYPVSGYGSICACQI